MIPGSALPKVSTDLTGRTVLVTGANTGLGYAAALKFLRMNPARLVLAVRDVSKGLSAARQLANELGADAGDGSAPQPTLSEGVVQVWECDLASFASVTRFVQKVDEELERLDIAVLNAAIATSKWATTADAWEVSLQANVISTGLLGVLLLPILQRTAAMQAPVEGVNLKPHLTIVASDMHYRARFTEHNQPKPLSALNNSTKFDGHDRYSTTKLLNVFLARKIAQLPKATEGGIVVNSVNPSLCQSDLGREAQGEAAARFQAMVEAFGRTAEEGVRNYIWAALMDTPGGAYVSDCHVEEPSRFVLSTDGKGAEDRVWNELVEIWYSVNPKTADIIA